MNIASSVAQRLVAIRHLFNEAADNGFIPYPLSIPISRVKGPTIRGRRIGNWLTAQQAEVLFNTPESYILKGKRDRAILAVLIGAGLRRQEVVNLTFEHLQIRENRWVIVDLIGKRKKIRSVPIPHWTRQCIDAWLEGAGIVQGRIFRAMRKGNRVVSNRMSTKAVRKVVKEYADQIGIAIAPHDLRRTYAKLARKGGAPLEQIQITLGHQSLETTQKYLGTDLDYEKAACDYIGINWLERSNRRA